MNDLMNIIGIRREESADQGGGGESATATPPSNDTTTGSDFEGSGEELGSPFVQTERSISDKSKSITNGQESREDRLEPFDPHEKGKSDQESERPVQGDKGERAPDEEDFRSTEVKGEGEQVDKFYDPEVHAKDRDVYPNSYETLVDAIDAIGAKLSHYEDQVSKLREMESDVGAVIDPELRKRIEQYSNDPTQIGEAETDDIRSFIVDIDEGLKAVGQKVSKVEKSYNIKKQKQELTSEYKEATQAGQEAVKSLNFADKLAELNNTPGAQVEDVLKAVDQTIESELSELDKAIEQHESDEDFVMDNGQQAYIQKLRKLEQQRDERRNELLENKDKLKNWFDVRDKVSNMEQQPESMSKQERLERSDEVFSDYLDDRVISPNAPDFFKRNSPNTIKTLRKFGFAPSNFEKYDLTTKDGWLQVEKAFISFRNKQIAKQDANSMKGYSKDKRGDKSDKYGPIPQPNRDFNMQTQHNGGNEQLRKSEENIARLSKKLSSQGLPDTFNSY